MCLFSFSQPPAVVLWLVALPEAMVVGLAEALMVASVVASVVLELAEALLVVELGVLA